MELAINIQMKMKIIKVKRREKNDNDTINNSNNNSKTTADTGAASVVVNEDSNLWIDTDGDSDSLNQIGAGCSIINGGGRLFMGTKKTLHAESSKFNNTMGIASGHFTKTNYYLHHL